MISVIHTVAPERGPAEARRRGSGGPARRAVRSLQASAGPAAARARATLQL